MRGSDWCEPKNCVFGCLKWNTWSVVISGLLYYISTTTDMASPLRLNWNIWRTLTWRRFLKICLFFPGKSSKGQFFRRTAHLVLTVLMARMELVSGRASFVLRAASRAPARPRANRAMQAASQAPAQPRAHHAMPAAIQGRTPRRASHAMQAAS